VVARKHLAALSSPHSRATIVDCLLAMKPTFPLSSSKAHISFARHLLTHNIHNQRDPRTNSLTR
jgi:hypothetical protein